MKNIRFDEMSWLYDNETEDLSSVEWILRYGNPTKEELLSAASILNAYKALIFKTQKDRNYICKKIQKGLDRG